MSAASTRRILTERHGRIEPLIPTVPIQSSYDKWRGLTLEKHRADADYVRNDFRVHSHLVHVFCGSPVTEEWRIDGRNHRVRHTAGSMMLAPQGLQASVRVSRSKPEIQWILELAPSSSEESLNGKKFEPALQLNLCDPQVNRLVQTLQADVENSCPTGSLFGELIGNSLIVYLSERYSTDSLKNVSTRGGLPALRLKRVLEYMQFNLDQDMHLIDLAETAGLSSFHFAKLFRQSTGVSPHQYILQRRLERAKELLRKPTLSLNQISLQSGFADQSHFTNVFRRFVGVTPSKFRSAS